MRDIDPGTMPPCKNDPARRFRGDEPSPKGLGWCAHAERTGSERRGKDGAPWHVATTALGVKRWVRGPAGLPAHRRPVPLRVRGFGRKLPRPPPKSHPSPRGPTPPFGAFFRVTVASAGPTTNRITLVRRKAQNPEYAWVLSLQAKSGSAAGGYASSPLIMPRQLRRTPRGGPRPPTQAEFAAMAAANKYHILLEKTGSPFALLAVEIGADRGGRSALRDLRLTTVIRVPSLAGGRAAPPKKAAAKKPAGPRAAPPEKAAGPGRPPSSAGSAVRRGTRTLGFSVSEA